MVVLGLLAASLFGIMVKYSFTADATGLFLSFIIVIIMLYALI